MRSLNSRRTAASRDAPSGRGRGPTNPPPGAFTPTEILAAWRAGASFVKVFPASAVGPGYIRDILAPLPFLRLVPSGGVSLENAGEWIRAGAAAVSVGSAPVPA